MNLHVNKRKSSAGKEHSLLMGGNEIPTMPPSSLRTGDKKRKGEILLCNSTSSDSTDCDRFSVSSTADATLPGREKLGVDQHACLYSLYAAGRFMSPEEAYARAKFTGYYDHHPHTAGLEQQDTYNSQHATASAGANTTTCKNDKETFIRGKSLNDEILSSHGLLERHNRMRRFLRLLSHSSICAGCSAKSCAKMKDLLTHHDRCDAPAGTECRLCVRVFNMLWTHAAWCAAEDCRVPWCSDLRPAASSSSSVVVAAATAAAAAASAPAATTTATTATDSDAEDAISAPPTRNVV